MSITVRLGEGRVVEASLAGHKITTDQPVEGGGGDSAPSPFDLFLASIATCAGYYVLDFCRTRDIPTEDIGLCVDTVRDEASGMIATLNIEIDLPDGFPERYREAVVRSAGLCSVKKHIERGLHIDVAATRSSGTAG